MAFPQPIHIDGGGGGKEIGQFGERKCLAKLGDLAGFQFQIGQLNGDFLQGVLVRMNETVELGLRPVQRIGQAIPASLHGFDFLQQHLNRM